MQKQPLKDAGMKRCLLLNFWSKSLNNNRKGVLEFQYIRNPTKGIYWKIIRSNIAIALLETYEKTTFVRKTYSTWFFKLS